MNSGDLLTSFALEELWNICETKHLDILLFSGAVFFMKIQNSRNDIKIFQMNFTDAALTRR